MLDFGSLLSLLLLLVEDTAASWGRMLVALAISVVVSLMVGIYTARSERAERVILPIVDIFQTLPILAFFPFVIFVIVGAFPGWIGINAAVIFLIITSMIWNIIFAVYEAIKTLPSEYEDVASLYKLSKWQRLFHIYIPAAIPRLVEQSELSWAIGLFYLVTSEIFSTGNAAYSVHYGIGATLTQLATSGDYTSYAIGILVFLAFVILTRELLFKRIERRLEKKSLVQKPHQLHAGIMHRYRLFRELERISMPRHRHEHALTAKRSGAAEIPQTPEHKRHWKYYTLLLAALLAALFALGAINQTTVAYEGLALVSLAVSFARIWLTFAIIIIVAVPLCVYLIFFAKKITAYSTLFQVLASIPATIILPVIAVALSGYMFHSNLVAISVFFLSGIWYIIFSILAAARALQSDVFDVRRLFGVRRLYAWKTIYIKAIMPGLITGAVTAIAAEWNASIVAEYFTSTGIGNGTLVSSVGIGIGKLLDTSLANGNLVLMAIALVNLTVMIILINTFVWKRLYKGISEVYR